MKAKLGNMSKTREKDSPETEFKNTEEEFTESAEKVIPDAPSQENQTAAEEVESLTPEEEARKEAAEWRDKYLRRFAEFENFRKRQRQESEMLGQIVRESMIVSLLTVKDDFDRMMQNDVKPDETFLKGVELIHNKLNAFFEQHKVKVMEGRGAEFDPDRHDALMMQPTEDFPAGTVLDVITPGYLIGDRVIRHAQVVVSAEPESDKNSETSEEA